MKKHFNKELVMPKEDNKDFENPTKYLICDNAYIDGDAKVRDHCHITRKCRGSSIRDCNINAKLNHRICVTFHNLKNYDSHLIMQELGKFNLKRNVIPNSFYLSFSIINKLSFIHSFKFLSSSLDSLVKNLAKDDFKCLSQEFGNNVLDLVKQKGPYPYKYMSILEKFKEELPNKEKLYSSLTGEKISDKEYEHVLKVWNKFEMETMKDYHDLHLKCDVILLTDVFEKFRNNSLKNYGLRASHYLSPPAFSWNAILNMTKVEFELIPDGDMYIFFQKGTRGGVSCISNRYSKTQNNFLKSHDPQNKNRSILYT